jgi:Transposase.
MPVAAKRTHYTDEFKREAVNALLKSGKPVIEMALVLGVEQSVLHRWKKKFGPDLAEVPQKTASGQVESNEIRALKTEMAHMKATINQLRTIFQKCMGDRYETLDLDELDQNDLLTLHKKPV